MSLRTYLPSAQFSLMVGSVAFAGLFVIGAEAYTAHNNPPATPEVIATNDTTASDTQWQSALAEIQASSGVAAPSVPDQRAVSQLLDAAKTNNVTATIGRTLLINLSNAKAQGLGSDLPTQDQLVANAEAQLPTATTSTYATGDLTAVTPNQTALHAYGNALIAAVLAHPQANVETTYELVGYATDYQDQSKLSSFPTMAAEYRALARDLAAMPVPQTLLPLHLTIANDFAAMAATYADMQTVLTDPLRGIAGLHQYESLAGEVSRVFISIGQTLNKDGILFSKDELGNAWNVLLSTSS